MKTIGRLTAILVILILIARIRPINTTDKSWWNRSGLSLHTDHLTGQQYLVSGFFGCGGITPRILKARDK